MIIHSTLLYGAKIGDNNVKEFEVIKLDFPEKEA